MNHTTFIKLVFFSLLGISCVGKKKYEAVLSTHQVEIQKYEGRTSILNREIKNKNRQIDTLHILYAQTRGANEALLATQDKHLNRIDEVQLQLENVRQDKSSTTQDLNSVVKEKEQIIAEKEAQILRIKSMIDKFEKDNIAVIGNLKWDLEQLFGDKQSITTINAEIRIIYEESLLFRPGSARVRTAGIQNLQKIAELMNKNPTLKLTVIGNTDNKRAKNYKDNWDYSVIRASNVVKVLTDEFALSPSRIIAGGKGEYSPKASNETPEGQAANRRIEFVILPRLDRVVKEIKKEVE